MPALASGMDRGATEPDGTLSSSPSSGQANNVTTSFYNADGDRVQTTNPEVETSVSAFDADGRTYCTADPVNVGSLADNTPLGHLSVPVPGLRHRAQHRLGPRPGTRPRSPTRQGSRPRQRTRSVTRPAMATTRPASNHR